MGFVAQRRKDSAKACSEILRPLCVLHALKLRLRQKIFLAEAFETTGEASPEIFSSFRRRHLAGLVRRQQFSFTERGEATTQTSLEVLKAFGGLNFHTIANAQPSMVQRPGKRPLRHVARFWALWRSVCAATCTGKPIANATTSLSTLEFIEGPSLGCIAMKTTSGR